MIPPRRLATFVWAGGCLLLAGLGCGGVGFISGLAPLTGPSYWAAETTTPLPTVTVFLGTTTPVYADTPVPGQVTTTPDWTTVTATPILPPPTATPFGFVATPFWVTTTPFVITETPPPPVTTTPGLPMIGFSTPVPQTTPYYRVGTFYMHSDVYIGGPRGLALRLTNHETAASPNQAAAVYHYLTVRVTNHSLEEVRVPLADLFFVRRVVDGDTTLSGRWTAQTEPLRARGLPAYELQQLTPIPPAGVGEFVLGFVLPQGEVPEVGLITDWSRPVEGGLPIWFYLSDDPLGPFNDAFQPPPPTAVVLDDDDTQAGGGGDDGGPGGSGGQWPTTGLISRGFGCADSFTGIDGAGFGCPPERPWFHNGVDIANVSGTLIWAPVDGTLLYAGPNSDGPDCSAMPGSQPPHEGLGNYQRLGDGQTLHYFGHLSQFRQTTGSVTAGQAVAEMGSSGCSTGSHLHWTMYREGQLVDPALWAGPGPAAAR